MKKVSQKKHQTLQTKVFWGQKHLLYTFQVFHLSYRYFTIYTLFIYIFHIRTKLYFPLLFGYCAIYTFQAVLCYQSAHIKKKFGSFDCRIYLVFHYKQTPLRWLLSNWMLIFHTLTHMFVQSCKNIFEYYTFRKSQPKTTFFSNKRPLSFKRPSPINAQYNPKNIL